MKAVHSVELGMKAASFARGKASVIVLAVLILSNLSLLLGYAFWFRNTGVPKLRSSKLKLWTSYSVLEPKEKELHLLQLQERQESKKKGLVEDMVQCSLAMGMSREELRTSMSNLTTVAAKVQTFLNAIQSVIPASYTQKTKNPCLHSNLTMGNSLRIALMFGIRGAKHLLKFGKELFHMTGGSTQLYCLPYFFIAGFPKSGTTTLHEALQQHPQIVRPTTKEPHWWTRVPLEDMNTDYLKLIILEYLLYFSATAKRLSLRPNEGMITYDGSQSTLWDSNFFMDNEDYCAMPAIVSRVLPNAKFIVLMRNPVTREYSNFFYSCGSNVASWPNHVQEDPPRQFHKMVELDTIAFDGCLKRTNNSIYKCMRYIRSVKSGCGSGHIGKRLPISLYHVHLNKWLQFYPRKNFLFLRTEDMCREPHIMMTRITKFLGVEPLSREKAQEWLCNQANAQNIYSTDPEKFKMKPETKQILEDFYKPFNAKLAELTNSKRFLWAPKAMY